MPSEIIFFLLAGLAIFSACMMVSRRRALFASFYFALTSLAISGILLQLRAPLLFAAQWKFIAISLIGLIVFAVEICQLDVALASEYRERAKIAALLVTVGLVLEFAAATLQHWLAPGSFTALLPHTPSGAPWAAISVLKFFFTQDALPLALMFFILLITAAGIAALFQKKI
jgi:NADH:ubiquinone oxidoreductase subunit 6 (subunit J)